VRACERGELYESPYLTQAIKQVADLKIRVVSTKSSVDFVRWQFRIELADEILADDRQRCSRAHSHRFEEAREKTSQVKFPFGIF
jgi:hypothetical protein